MKSNSYMFRLLSLLIFLAASLPSYAQDDAWSDFANRDYEKAVDGLRQEVRLSPEWEVAIDALGWCYYFLGEYSNAEDCFEKALSINDEYKWSLQGLAAVDAAKAAPLAAAQELLDAGRYLEARAAFIEIHKGNTAAGDNSKAEALLGEGLSLQSLGRHADAIKVIKSALKLKSDYAEAYRAIASSQYATSDWRNALVSYELSFKSEPDHYPSRIAAAWCQYWKKDYRKSVKAFERARSCSDQPWEAEHGLAWSWLRLNNDDKALAAFERGIEISPYALDSEAALQVNERPAWSHLHALVGWSALRQHLNSLALSEFEKAIRLFPEDNQSMFGLAFSYFRTGEYDKAIRTIDRANSMSSEEVIVSFPWSDDSKNAGEVKVSQHSLRAWCLYRQGLYSAALSEFKNVLKNHPSWLDAACGEGWTLFSQGDYPGAEKVFLRVAKDSPGYVDATSGIAAVTSWRFTEYYEAWEFINTGEFSRAVALLERLRDKDGWRFPPNRGDLLAASIAWAQFLSGNISAAEKAFQESLSRNPELGLALRGMGDLLQQKEDWSGAQIRYESCLNDSDYTNNADTIAQIGWCKFEQEDHEAAISDFRRAQEFDPNCAAALAGEAAYHLFQQNFVDARVLLERAVGIDPEILDRSFLQNCFELDDELYKLHSPVAWSYFYRSKTELAERHFRLALKLDPNEESVKRGLGLLLLRSDRIDEGAILLNAYLENCPEVESSWGLWSSTLSELGWALYAEENFKQAMTAFKRINQLHDGQRVEYADGWNGLGWCRLRMGKERDARKSFLEAVARDPRNETALSGLEALKEME